MYKNLKIIQGLNNGWTQIGLLETEIEVSYILITGLFFNTLEIVSISNIYLKSVIEL